MTGTKVLLPLDGSSLAETALAALAAWSALGPLRVHLVSVVEKMDGLARAAEDEYMGRERSLLDAYLHGVAERLRQQPEIDDVDVAVLVGEPAEVILAPAQEFAPNVIVISTHGRSGLSHWRLGSVADAVIRRGKHNTLVVGPNARLRTPVRSLLVGLDGSELSEQALPLAEALAHAFDATLHLVRVIVSPVSTSERYQQWFTELEEFAEAYLGGVRDRLSFAGKIVAAARIGSPAERLIDYAASHEVDLMVMTSHGRGGLARSVFGSVAARYET